MMFFILGQNKNSFFISDSLFPNLKNLEIKTRFKKLTPIRKIFSNGAGKKSLLYFSIVIFVALLCLGLIRYFSQMPESKKEIPLPEKLQPKTEPLTPEKIQEELSKKAEPSPETQPLKEKEIQQVLQKKIPENERPRPLTPEEIQKALNAK
ncbi:hypothetical protein KJ636_00395 [Patescibacteria group bacterium]|nr:hypothetical protein [Patescibacteria group bacterium]